MYPEKDERKKKRRNPVMLATTALLLAASLACETLRGPKTPMPVCTPPPCGPDEVYYCPGDCPGGCGTICVTATKPTPTPPPTDAPRPLCTPPLCGPDEVYYCPGDCPGGCGTICVTPTPAPATGILALTLGTYSETYTEGEHPTVYGTVTLGDEPLAGASLSLEMSDEADTLLWQTAIQSSDGGSFMIPLTYGDEIPTGYSGQLRVSATVTHEGAEARAETTFSYAPQPESAEGCERQAWGWFQGALELMPGVRDEIGCPTEDHRELNAASQDFERGYMVWREDERLTYVICEGSGWESYADRWQQGMPEQDPSYGPPPEGLIQPKRGFGLVWQENPAVRDGLGWALNEERQCDQADVQRFEHGLMLACTKDVVPRAKIHVFILFDDHTYDIYAPP